MAEQLRYVEIVRHKFSPDELRELGEKLAREAQQVFSMEREKSEISALLNSRIKESTNRVSDLSKKINCGFEEHEIECVAVFDAPVRGMKRLVSVDTGETIRELPMTPDELKQERLDFSEGAG